jgi:hypothetical protein
MQMLQQPHQITFLYDYSYEIRHVRMNEPHPAHVTPSWYGDSVGRYEGDTLVIDTVGIRTDRPFAMLDFFGTPYTKALHVVERYRLSGRVWLGGEPQPSGRQSHWRLLPHYRSGREAP